VFATIDELGSAYFLLLKISEIERYLGWLEVYHQITMTKELLSGYKVLIDSAFRCFLQEVYESTALNISEDEVLSRAQFKGVALNETPNTCEKTILLKRIWSHGRTVSKAKTWQEVEQAMMRMKTDLDVFRRLLENYSSTQEPFSKDLVVKSIACGQLLNFFIDTSHNISKAALVFPSIEYTATEQYLSSAYPGYVYGLQYLWYSILGSEEFERTCVRELHLALDAKEVEKYPKPENVIEEIFKKSGLFVDSTQIDNPDLNEDERDIIEGIHRLTPPGSERWATLDRFFESINEEIVRPREERLKTSFGWSRLIVLDGYAKDLLKELLDPSQVAEPEYLSKKDRDSCKKLLALAMLWYEVNVLDTQGLVVFNGAPAFASSILGTVEVYRAHHSQVPVKAIIFKHPVGPENEFGYSFGVFVPVYGSLGLSDNSGWLIFFDCKNNYAGFGESSLGFAGAVIRHGQKRGRIAFQEIIVDKELFKEYLREHSVSSVFDMLIKETPVGSKEVGRLTAIVAELLNFVGFAKGKLLEHVAQKWVESQGFHETTCDTWINGEQIDCVGRAENSLSFFECKLNVHQDTIRNTMNQITRKSIALSKATRRVKACLIVYDRVSAGTKRRFEKKGIFVQDNFRALIQKEKCFEGTRVETLQLLDWQFRTPGKFRPEY